MQLILGTVLTITRLEKIAACAQFKSEKIKNVTIGAYQKIFVKQVKSMKSCLIMWILYIQYMYMRLCDYIFRYCLRDSKL